MSPSKLADGRLRQLGIGLFMVWAAVAALAVVTTADFKALASPGAGDRARRFDADDQNCAALAARLPPPLVAPGDHTQHPAWLYLQVNVYRSCMNTRGHATLGQPAPNTANPYHPLTLATQASDELFAFTRVLGGQGEHDYAPEHWIAGGGCRSVQAIELEGRQVCVTDPELRKAYDTYLQRLGQRYRVAAGQRRLLYLRFAALGWADAAESYCAELTNAEASLSEPPAQADADCRHAHALVEAAAAPAQAEEQLAQDQAEAARIAAAAQSQREADEQQARQREATRQQQIQEAAAKAELDARRARRDELARDPKMTTLFAVTIDQPLVIEPCSPGEVDKGAVADNCWETVAAIMDRQNRASSQAAVNTVSGMLGGNAGGAASSLAAMMAPLLSVAASSQLPPIVFSSMTNPGHGSLGDSLAGVVAPTNKVVHLTPTQRANFPWIVSDLAVVESQGSVAAIQWVTDDWKNREPILDALNDKFGPPTKASAAHPSGPHPVETDPTAFHWQTPMADVELRFGGDGTADTRGLITVTSRRQAQALRDQKKSKAKL